MQNSLFWLKEGIDESLTQIKNTRKCDSWKLPNNSWNKIVKKNINHVETFFAYFFLIYYKELPKSNEYS